jgi:hypothetical protein
LAGRERLREKGSTAIKSHPRLGSGAPDGIISATEKVVEINSLQKIMRGEEARGESAALRHSARKANSGVYLLV